MIWDKFRCETIPFFSFFYMMFGLSVVLLSCVLRSHFVHLFCPVFFGLNARILKNKRFIIVVSQLCYYLCK